MAKSRKPKDRKPILIYINGEIAAKVLQFSRILGLSRSIIIENLMTKRLNDSLPLVEKELLKLTQHTDDTNTGNKRQEDGQDLDGSGLTDSGLSGQSIQQPSGEDNLGEPGEKEQPIPNVTHVTEGYDGYAEVGHQVTEDLMSDGDQEVPSGITNESEESGSSNTGEQEHMISGV